MESAAIAAYLDGREFEMLCILIFVSGMFVGGVLTQLCCRRSVQVVIDARNQQESIGKKQTRDVSVAVNEMNLPVFADWLDMHDSYYRTEKGTVMHLTPSCSYAKGRALARFHFCQKCLMMMWREETSEISKPSLRSASIQWVAQQPHFDFLSYMWYVHEGCFSTRCKGNASMMCCSMGSLVSEVTKSAHPESRVGVK